MGEKRPQRLPKNPQPKEWLAKDHSLQYVADYKPFNFVDGEGVRCSVYVSGCLFNCPGCYNKAAQKLPLWSALYPGTWRSNNGRSLAELCSGTYSSWWRTVFKHSGLFKVEFIRLRNGIQAILKIFGHGLDIPGKNYWRILMINWKCFIILIFWLMAGSCWQKGSDFTIPGQFQSTNYWCP